MWVSGGSPGPVVVGSYLSVSSGDLTNIKQKKQKNNQGISKNNNTSSEKLST